MPFTVDTYARELAATSSFAGLWSATIAYFAANDAHAVTYNHMRPGHDDDWAESFVIAAEGYPSAWVERYFQEELHRIDPTPRAVRQHGAPFLWSQIAELDDLTPGERDFVHLASTERGGDSIVVPLFGPHGRDGFVIVGHFDAPPHLADQALMRMKWGCQIGHMRYCDLLYANKPDLSALTEAELDLLRLTAKGFSNSKIATKRDLDADSLERNYQALFDKLEVIDRSTAAIRAIALGAI